MYAANASAGAVLIATFSPIGFHGCAEPVCFEVATDDLAQHRGCRSGHRRRCRAVDANPRGAVVELRPCKSRHTRVPTHGRASRNRSSSGVCGGRRPRRAGRRIGSEPESRTQIVTKGVHPVLGLRTGTASTKAQRRRRRARQRRAEVDPVDDEARRRDSRRRRAARPSRRTRSVDQPDDGATERTDSLGRTRSAGPSPGPTRGRGCCRGGRRDEAGRACPAAGRDLSFPEWIIGAGTRC